MWGAMKKVNSTPARSSKAINMHSILWSWYTGLIQFILTLLWQTILDLNAHLVLLGKTELLCTLKEGTTLWNLFFTSSFALHSVYEDRQVQFSENKVIFHLSHSQKTCAIIRLDLLLTVTYTALLKRHRIEEDYSFKWCLTFVCNLFIFINIIEACTGASRHENYSTKVSIFIWVTIHFTVIATWLIIHDSEL